MKKIIVLLGILTVLILMVTPMNLISIVPNTVFPFLIVEAQEEVPAPDPFVILHRLMDLMRTILISVAVIGIIWGAFSFVTASGDDKKLETGRKAILYSVIAVIVATVAHGVIVWVEIFFR